jgi:PAS domain-containing protein
VLEPERVAPAAAPTAVAPWGHGATHDPERRQLAHRITEEVLQLLYTAHQDLAEVGERGVDADPALVRSAQECTLGAISILRVIADSVVRAAWSVPPPAAVVAGNGAEAGGATSWTQDASLLFQAMSDAWLVTCSDRDLLYASDAACVLLGRTREEVTYAFRREARWPDEIERAVRRVVESGDARYTIEVPMKDGTLRPLRVVTHLLPAVPGVKRSYISLLSEG